VSTSTDQVEPDTGERDREADESVESVGSGAPDEPSESTVDEPARRRIPLPVLLLAAAVLLSGAGAGLLLAGQHARSTASATNRALVDAAATAEVSASVTNSLNRVFSYSYDKTAVTEQTASEVLRGGALDTYRALFSQVRTLAPAQKLVLTSRVVNIAVGYLDGDRAQVLAFLDQSATRGDTNATSAAAAQLSVTVKREGNKWVITDLTPR
jgi:Mce-associated membrane protein